MSAALAADFSRLLARAGVRAGARVLVAVSGGADSMALLHLLRFHAAPLQALPGTGPAGPPDPEAAQLTVAHFDHGMRRESAADAAWVRGVCIAWDLPLVEGVSDVPLRSETAARSARWSFLMSAAAQAGADVIVTAHHADDQAETVLHRIIRGTAMPGLAGIPRRRVVRSGAWRGRIARPLLDIRRATLRDYCRAHGLRWREDATNAQPRTVRNRIRLQLLPALERARPGATDRLVRLAGVARVVEDAWRNVLDEVREAVVLERAEGRIVLAREALLGYDPQVRSRVLRHELRRLGRVPGRSGTRAVDEFIRSGTSGKGIALGGGVRIERERDRILLRRVRASTPDQPLRIAAPQAGVGKARIGGRRFTVAWAPGHAPDDAGTFDVDPSALAFPLELRAWRPGDRIRLAYGGKKLKKLFLERGLGRAQRAATPVLADAAGRVVWVPGIARAHAFGPVEGAPGFHITVADD